MPVASVGLRQWIWRAFAQSALIPLFLVETVLIAIYLLTNNAIRDSQIGHLRETALNDLQTAASMEARLIDEQLAQVGSLTALYRNLTQEALSKPPLLAIPDNLGLTPSGVRYSTSDNGGAAVFYSGVTPPERHDLNKLAKLSSLDSLMRSIRAQNPLIAALYFNTWDSLNHIYPWFSTPEQYPHDMAIPDYNFYYQADAKHNPTRKVVWTDVYLDPAGQGWMMSAIAPAYNGDKLEGVNGIDITVDGILNQINQLQVPWNGYAMLVSNELNIMALPKAGEDDFRLRELTQHSYEEAIRRELFKPADFNLAKREETRQLAEAMGQQPAGIQRISLNGRMQLVAWSSIPQTKWHLLTVVSEDNVFAQTNSLAERYKNIGYLLIAGLVLFYIGFFSVMWWRSRRLSQRLIDPIEGVSLMLEQIGQGDLRPKRVESRIVELSQAADSALKLGQQLETSEERRMHVQQRLELVLDSATEGLWEADLLDGTIAINGRFAPRFGLQGQRFTLQNFRSRVHPDDLAVLDNAMREVYRPNHDRYQAEFRFSDELGHYHWLLSRGRVLERDPNGYVRLLSGTLVDIDALKHVQDDLRQASLEAQAASQAKSRFMSSVTHELRTPLNAIQGFAQLLRLQYPQTTEPQGTDYLEEILRASQHLTQLVGDVLDWSSLPVDRPRLDFQAIPTTTLFAECAELVRNEANAQQLTLIINADPTLAVRGEQRRLRQVLLNLLSNAIKYNRPAGSVILSAEARGEQVRLQVEDTGMGMSIEQQAQLFEPFQRLGRENTAIQGTGIGLVLSRELATLMGGTLGFESEVGRGSRFWIDLPLAPLETVAASAAGDFPMPDAAACIVFADSDTSSRELAQHAFETYPHVQMVSHSDELLALLREQSLGLLLLDQKLPGLSSAEIIRHIRQSAQNTGLPVVMLCHPEMAVEALMLDCQGLLSKPLDANELGTLVDALLKEKTANVQ